MVATVLLSILAVGAVGLFLSQQVRSGLLEHRVTLVTAEAANEVRDARSRLSATPGIDTVGYPASRARRQNSASSHLMKAGRARPTSRITSTGMRHIHQPL